MMWKIFTWLLPAWNLVASALLVRYVAFRSADTREREVAMWGSTSDATPAGRMIAWGLVVTSAVTLVAMLVTRSAVVATLPWAQFIANAVADRYLGSDAVKLRARNAASAAARSGAH